MKNQFSHVCTIYEDRYLYCFGGSYTSCSECPDIYYFDLKESKWEGIRGVYKYTDLNAYFCFTHDDKMSISAKHFEKKTEYVIEYSPNDFSLTLFERFTNEPPNICPIEEENKNGNEIVINPPVTEHKKKNPKRRKKQKKKKEMKYKKKKK